MYHPLYYCTFLRINAINKNIDTHYHIADVLLLGVFSIQKTQIYLPVGLLITGLS